MHVNDPLIMSIWIFGGLILFAALGILVKWKNFK